MYVCLLCLLTVISLQKQTVKLIVLLQLFDPSVVYYLTMATRITLLSEFKTIDDSHLAITFTENLDSIFSYNHKDIAITLDERVADALATLRNELFEKIKTNFPEYQSKCLIARKAKHLLIQDIIQFGYSIVNKNVTREMEKAFSKNDPSSHTNETDLVFDLYFSTQRMAIVRSATQFHWQYDRLFVHGHLSYRL